MLIMEKSVFENNSLDCGKNICYQFMVYFF